MNKQPLIAAGIALAIVGALMSGCEKKAVTESTPSQSSKEVVVSPPPASPPPPQADSKSVQSPQPGQVNDHSSPAFKGGGAPDKGGKDKQK